MKKNTVSEGDTNLRAGRHCVRTDTQTHADDHETLRPTARR